MEEFSIIEKGAIHITEYGYCVHDFIMSPCETYRDCLNCSEQVIVKGNNEQLENIQWCLEQANEQLLIAEDAIAESLSGVDRWYEYHKLTVARLSELVAMLKNPTIEEGALLRLDYKNVFSQTNRVLNSKHPLKTIGTSKNLSNLATGLGV